MGSRGSRRRGGGGGKRGNKSSAGPTTAQIRKTVDQQIDKLPAKTKKRLVDHSVKTETLGKQAAEKKFGADAKTARGFYTPRDKTVSVLAEHFQSPGSGGLPNAAMTALHELGHAFDFAVRSSTKIAPSQSKEFHKALTKDRRAQNKIFSRQQLTDEQQRGLKYGHYPAAKRAQEVWAEGFAVTHGQGRPIPDAKRPDWNDSDLFKLAWKHSLALIKKLTTE